LSRLLFDVGLVEDRPKGFGELAVFVETGTCLDHFLFIQAILNPNGFKWTSKILQYLLYSDNLCNK